MIDITGLTVRYAETVALSEVSLTIPEGSLTCLIGPNGSGKTTLLKAMGGLVPVYKGSVSIDGKQVAAMKGIERAKRIAYLPQSRPVPDMTALMLIQHGRFPHQGFARSLSAKDHTAVDQAVAMTGTDELLNKPVAALSGGERQRVYIAMALAQESDIILLDEPMAGLDLRYQVGLMNIVRTLHQRGKTIVMVTHDLPLAFSEAESLCLMSSGRILCHTVPEESDMMTLLPAVFGYSLRKSADCDAALYRYQVIKNG